MKKKKKKKKTGLLKIKQWTIQAKQHKYLFITFLTWYPTRNANRIFSDFVKTIISSVYIFSGFAFELQKQELM